MSGAAPGDGGLVEKYLEHVRVGKRLAAGFALVLVLAACAIALASSAAELGKSGEAAAANVGTFADRRLAAC